MAKDQDDGRPPLRLVPGEAAPDAQDLLAAELADHEAQLAKIRDMQASMNSGGLGAAMYEAFAVPSPSRHRPRR